MTQKFPLKTLHVRQKGVFDYEKLYNYIYKWFHDRKYRTQEDKYKYKPDSAWGYEHEVVIKASKKVDAYFQYKVEVKLHVRDGTEIEHDGKRLMNGRIHITIEATVITDYSGRFEKSKFTKLLEKAYNTILVKREIEMTHADALHYRLHDFQEEMKKILKMYADVNYWKGA